MDSQPVRKEDSGESADETLVREIREDYTYFRDFWADNNEEAKTDLRFVAGDPWDKEARQQREDNNRPVLCPDEFGQYLNSTINNLRQNKRAIKVNPTGSGANDKTAAMRAALIRGIEYASNAQSAYTNAFENAINCGIGFFRVTTKYVNKDKEVEPRIKIIENPMSVLLDPNAKEADFSDQKRCFVLDVMRQRDFARMYPKAQKRSFSAEDVKTAPEWFAAENILVAEYWRIDGYDADGEGGKVTQYITNGIEILERNEWPGSWIPIIAVTGKRVYKPTGSDMKRYFYSMIRLARGSQQLLAYIVSQEAEEYGMAPRSPYVGYVGQFETDAEAWESLNKVPRAYVQIDPVVDQGSGSILPMPQRVPFTPNAQAYEIGKESARRSIQASMGITPLPTAAQRQNEKSGVALDKIQAQQAIGSFHFTDNFDRALENAGRQLNELITKVMDTPRQVGVRQPDETHDMMHIAPGGKMLQPQSGEQPVSPENALDPQQGDYDVTISTGMSYDSQRQEASAFVDLLISELGNLPLAAPAKASLLAKAITLKDIGPIGDEIAKIIDPQGDGEPVPPQAQQAMAQLQDQLKALNAACQHYEQKIQELEFEKKAQIVKGANDVKIKQMEIEADIAKAEITTKAQNVEERLAFVEDMAKQFQIQAHERAMQAEAAQQQQVAQEQAAGHQQDLQQQSAENTSAQSAQDAAQASAASQPEA